MSFLLESNTIIDVLGININNLDDDYLKEYCSDDEDLIRIMEADTDGCNTIFPGGTTCHVGDKIIPLFVTCSPSSSITTTTLTQYLWHIDTYLTLDRFVANLHKSYTGTTQRKTVESCVR